jgi:hypothetical protein
MMAFTWLREALCGDASPGCSLFVMRNALALD